MKLVAKFFVIFLFAFVLLTNPLTVSAQSNASGLCDDSDMYSCKEPYSCYCPPLNPTDPNNTNIPNYSTRACICVPPGPSTVTTPKPVGGGPLDCRALSVDCPPGAVIDYNHPVSVACEKEHDMGAWCSAPGNAQKVTGCCSGALYSDPDNPDTMTGCTNKQYTTYNCCPAGSIPQCIDGAKSTYNVVLPAVIFTPPVGNACGANTVKSSTLINCRDIKYGSEWVNICDNSIVCEATEKICGCSPITKVVPTPVVTASPIPTPVPTGQCSMTKIYTNGWVELTPQAFSGLTQGIQVYFCVNGVTNTSVFDSGRFTINGVVRPQTTVKKPGTNDFCDLYTIPANTYSFKVQGELHHTLLGWL